MSMNLRSPALAAFAPIDSRYTCEGEDISPRLIWSGVPEDAQSLALVVDDPDARKTSWVHWVLYNLPASLRELPEAVEASGLPAGTLEGLNDWRETGYRGPCPPKGRHRYYFTLYALDCMLPDLKQPNKAQLERAMQGHVLGKSELMATYQKHASS